MDLCTDEYKKLNEKLEEVINYKESFKKFVASNPAAAYEDRVADRDIAQIKKQLEDLKTKANEAEELARKAEESAAEAEKAAAAAVGTEAAAVGTKAD